MRPKDFIVALLKLFSGGKKLIVTLTKLSDEKLPWTALITGGKSTCVLCCLFPCEQTPCSQTCAHFAQKASRVNCWTGAML